MFNIDNVLFLEGDDGAGAGAGGTGAGAGTAKPKLSDLISEHGLQDDLNAMMAENRRKLTQQNQELVTQLEQLKTNTQLTQEERDGLQVRITQLEEQYMSKEELSKREASKQQKQYEEMLKAAKNENEQWKGLYSNSTIERSLLDAAVDGEAIRGEQIVGLLRNNTQLSEVIENGKGTGNFTTIVKFTDVDENGKSVILDLSPVEAIKRMKELPDRFGNLFKGTATGGLGGSRNADGSATTHPKLDELLKDPVKYAKWRKDNPELDISKLRR